MLRKNLVKQNARFFPFSRLFKIVNYMIQMYEYRGVF